jgi:ankyrin repeat protein
VVAAQSHQPTLTLPPFPRFPHPPPSITPHQLLDIAKLERLWWAAHDNDKEAAEQAIKDGANINDFYHNEAPLHKAAANGHEDMVRFLIEKGARINHKHSSHKRTALKHAAYRGHLHVVKALHELGADLHATGTFHEGHKDAHGWAVHHGHHEVADYLHKAKTEDLASKKEAHAKRVEQNTKRNLEEERKHRRLPPVGASDAVSEL